MKKLLLTIPLILTLVGCGSSSDGDKTVDAVKEKIKENSKESAGNVTDITGTTNIIDPTGKFVVGGPKETGKNIYNWTTPIVTFLPNVSIDPSKTESKTIVNSDKLNVEHEFKQYDISANFIQILDVENQVNNRVNTNITITENVSGIKNITDFETSTIFGIDKDDIAIESKYSTKK